MVLQISISNYAKIMDKCSLSLELGRMTFVRGSNHVAIVVQTVSSDSLIELYNMEMGPSAQLFHTIQVV